MNELGSLYRIRIYRNIDCTQSEQQMHFVQNKTIEGFASFEETYLSQGLFTQDDSGEVLTGSHGGHSYEDFSIKGSFSLTALNFQNGDTITYSRNFDYYQYRIIKREVDNQTQEVRWVEK